LVELFGVAAMWINRRVRAESNFDTLGEGFLKGVVRRGNGEMRFRGAA